METGIKILNPGLIIATFESEQGNQNKFVSKILFENVITTKEQQSIEFQLDFIVKDCGLETFLGKFRIAAIVLIIVSAILFLPVILDYEAIPKETFIIGCVILSIFVIWFLYSLKDVVYYSFAANRDKELAKSLTILAKKLLERNYGFRGINVECEIANNHAVAVPDGKRPRLK
jgi:hypothetical protein